MQINVFNKEQLLILNQLIQALPIGQRKSYLEGLGELWDYLSTSDGYFVDERDYNVYTVVRIGHQEWLGENLRYKGVPHYENPANPNLFYGYLYDWATVMNIETKYNEERWKGRDEQHQGIAPTGWHIPSDEDWLELEQRNLNDDWRGVKMGKALKSSNDWYGGGDGINSKGFSSLPVGYSWSESFYDLGKSTDFWTSTESTDDEVWTRTLRWTDEYLYRYSSRKGFGHACRCIKR